jgi:hypothetical protein
MFHSTRLSPRWMEHSIFSPHENILTIALINIHYLYSRYFYSFTYLTPVSIYFVSPNDPRMHCDLFWEKTDTVALLNCSSAFNYQHQFKNDSSNMIRLERCTEYTKRQKFVSKWIQDYNGLWVHEHEKYCIIFHVLFDVALSSWIQMTSCGPR